MSGYGERFRRAGYAVPKPLIDVDGKPVIGHVIDLFPGETDFTFICNREHLESPSYRLREALERHCPTGRIVAIEPHKLGPVHAVLQAADLIDPERPAIVNYCDFACYWDWDDFRRFVESTACDGAIPCYSGFHPHMLGSTNYAYVRVVDGWVTAIQEKRPFTADPMKEHASSGTYYFRSGALLREYFSKSVRPDLSLNGEYYVSMAYKPMLDDGRNIAVYGLQHFMQWGTPEDLEEYAATSRAFSALAAGSRRTPRHSGIVLVPAAGQGSRFANEGYAQPKPLVPVSARPMLVQAVRDLPEADERLFVLRRDLPGMREVAATLDETFPGCRTVWLDGPTEGQAMTCLAAADAIAPDKPLTIGACDNGALYDAGSLERLLGDPECDVIVWGARGHAGAARHPEMYGWIAAESDRVTGVLVKVPLTSPRADPIVVGTFTFKRAGDFVASARRMIARDARVNGEYYVDTCINDAIALGLRVRLFEIDHYLCWGTPNDLRTFEYWQSCFHNWTSHPYRLERDADVPSEKVAGLAERYRSRPVPRPRERP